MDDYKPNSHRFKEAQQSKQPVPAERKKVEKVISGSAQIKKKTDLGSFLGLFFAGDPKTIGTRLLENVVIPLVKRGASDTIDYLVYGDAAKSKNSIIADRVSYRTTNYNTISSGTHNQPEERVVPACNYDSIKLESRGDAEALLMGMDALIEQYGVASVADLCELAQVSYQHTDNRYGWSNFSKAEILRSRDGYILKLPKPIPIESMK